MKREWLIWLFLVVTSIAIVVSIAPVKAQEQPIAYCNEEGQCVIARDMLAKLMRAVVYWHDKAEKCSAI